MARPGERGPTDTGIDVYPKLPVPKSRESDQRLGRRPSGGFGKKQIAALSGVLVAGGVVGFLVRPALKSDSRVGALEDTVADQTKAANAQKARADSLEADLDKTKTKLGEAEKAQGELSTQAKTAQAKAAESEAAQAKLKAVVDKNIGIISADGEEIRLQLVDRVLFKTYDDQLTAQGKNVLDRVAGALKELPDKQIWVQGHTDDQPIANIPPPNAPKPPPPKKGQKPPPPPPPPTVKFATNWELSAARALTVVHYLQDTSKIDPSRLAALAFGQYRPISKTNRGANRRIEIVLYPKPVVKKDK